LDFVLWQGKKRRNNGDILRAFLTKSQGKRLFTGRLIFI